MFPVILFAFFDFYLEGSIYQGNRYFLFIKELNKPDLDIQIIKNFKAAKKLKM